jgi:hypothetical protein
MAFVTILTTSIHDIMEIHANLAALESARVVICAEFR